MKWLRFFVILIVESGLALLLAYTRDNELSYMALSDGFFVVGILIGLPSIVVISNAPRLFYGFRYAVRLFINPSFKKIHPSFRDYQLSKNDNNPNQTFLLEVIVSSIILIIFAFIISR